MKAQSAQSSAGPPAGGSGKMFDQIAARYDLMNRLISFGQDQIWRRKTAAALKLRPGCRVLDLATGTADLAILIAQLEANATLVGLDPSVEMLKVGHEKVAALNLDTRLELIEGDAESLPFEADSFDGITMAFGIRNVPNRAKALAEMARVTRPGGRIAILELSEPKGGLLSPFTKFHVHHVVPWVGGMLSGSAEYKYLQKSIAAFPAPESFAQVMEQAGLNVLDIQSLTFGACHLYVAEPQVAAEDSGPAGAECP